MPQFDKSIQTFYKIHIDHNKICSVDHTLISLLNCTFEMRFVGFLTQFNCIIIRLDSWFFIFSLQTQKQGLCPKVHNSFHTSVD